MRRRIKSVFTFYGRYPVYVGDCIEWNVNGESYIRPPMRPVCRTLRALGKSNMSVCVICDTI